MDRASKGETTGRNFDKLAARYSSAWLSLATGKVKANGWRKRMGKHATQFKKTKRIGQAQEREIQKLAPRTTSRPEETLRRKQLQGASAREGDTKASTKDD